MTTHIPNFYDVVSQNGDLREHNGCCCIICNNQKSACSCGFGKDLNTRYDILSIVDNILLCCVERYPTGKTHVRIQTQICCMYNCQCCQNVYNSDIDQNTCCCNCYTGYAGPHEQWEMSRT